MKSGKVEKLGIPKINFKIGYSDSDGNNELELKIIARKINEIIDILNGQLSEQKPVIPTTGVKLLEAKKNKNIVKSKDVHWVCKDCGLKYGNHGIKGIATWHMDTCDICKRSKSVTEIRDFGHLKEEENDNDWYKPEIRELIRENLDKIHLKIGDSYGIDVTYLHRMISEYAEEQRKEARDIAVRMVLVGLILRCEVEKKDSISLEFLKSIDPEKLLKTDRN